MEPVTHEPERVVDYAMKSVRRGRVSYEDAILVLPRTRDEVESEKRQNTLHLGAASGLKPPS